MKLVLVLVAVAASFASSKESGQRFSLRHSQHARSLTSSGSLDDYIFFISNIRMDEQWCLTVTDTSEHGDLGFRECDNSRPASQLWKLEGDGLLRSGVQTNFGEACAVVGFGHEIFDGIRIRLGPCDPDSIYYKFSWDMNDFYLKTQAEGYCLTNRGPNPDESDSILAHQQCINRGDYLWNVVDGNAAPPTPAPTPGTVGCPANQESGGQGSFVFNIDLGQTSGTVDVEYEMFVNPDSLVITYEGTEIFSTGGLVSGSESFQLTYGSPTSTSTIITATLEAPNEGTEWELFVGCPI